MGIQNDYSPIKKEYTHTHIYKYKYKLTLSYERMTYIAHVYGFINL